MGQSSGPNLMKSWTETSSQVFANLLRANQLAFTPVSPSGGDTGERDGEIDAETTLPSWRSGSTAEEVAALEVGDRVTFSKEVADEDIRSFAAASGDTNPLHLSEEFGEETMFGERIAHGTLVAGLISAALARLPGLVVYLSQDLEFHNPVSVGDQATAECHVVEDLGNDQYRLNTTVSVDETTVIDGEAVVMIQESPEE